ncbi:MAG: hypothetical protein AMXMBFR45_14990 [Gammaproteobacteria bacterium]|nr:MAG: hypothetical protein EDM71_01940 [Pseudomonadota bacterium]MBC6945234.1 hypothetical protein [Gammaproteobacteria bacterium]MCE7901121.1 hypothetical protein [Gammaproteobacteria bacterium PRO9]MDL1880093.1 hypothetical protein [Gammaproteobacteria bacterium PRO2]MCQ3933932.1 hypothetical protein [Gammaproteobacteria bacterium]
MLAAAAPATQPATPGRRASRMLPGLVLLLVVLPACSTGFIYNRVGWAVAWYVEGLVSLDGAQQQLLRDSVQRTLAWHRETQLERYEDLLERLAAAAAGPVTADDLRGYYEEAEHLLADFLGQVAPDVAQFLGSLDAAQRAELARNLEEDNADLRQERAGQSAEVRRKRRDKSAIRTVQRFVGRLAPVQRQLVVDRMATMQDLSSAWLERRLGWQRRLLALLESADRGSAFGQALRELLLDPGQADGGAYQSAAEANRRVVFEMLAALSTTLSPAQRAQLQRKLHGYARDLRRLADPA